MINTKVATRYAKGLLKYAEEGDLLDELFLEAESLIKLINQSKDLRAFLNTPILDIKTKNRIMKNILHKYSRPIQKFCELLIRHKREIHLFNTLKAFVDLRNKSKGIKTAIITTAKELSKEEYNAILGKLEDSKREKINLTIKVDKGIIGGFIMKIGDKQIDQSIIGKLQSLNRQFKDNLYVPKY